jgi:imidazoleglycerol-phosphate dehydratase
MSNETRGDSPIKKPRSAEVKRVTRETDVSLSLDLDGDRVEAGTGLAFFDHLLMSMAFHGRFALLLKGRGDLDVDGHHLVEDVGLVLGEALAAVFSRTQPIARFGHAVVPMDEALAEVVIDVCGRPTLVYHARFPQERVGSFDTALLKEFFSGLAAQARMSLHAEARAGENSHHMAEALFKALGKAIGQAYRQSEGQMSTKGRIG